MTDPTLRAFSAPAVRYFQEVARAGSFRKAAEQLNALLCFDVAPRIGMSFAGEYALKSCVLVPRGHPFEGKRTLSLAECAEYPLILPDETQYLRGILDQMFHEVGAKPTPYIQTN